MKRAAWLEHAHTNIGFAQYQEEEEEEEAETTKKELFQAYLSISCCIEFKRRQ